MKALLITQHFAPQLGGIQNNLRSVVQSFSPEKIVIIAPIEKVPSNEPGLTRYKIIRKPFVKIVGFMFSIVSLYSLIKQFSPDVIICGHVKQAIEGYLLSRLSGKPYVVFVYAREIHKLSKNKIKRIILQFVLKRARKIIVISEYTKDITRSFLNAKRDDMFALLHPIHEPAISVSDEVLHEVRTRYKTEGRHILFSVSRLEERKGIDVVIQSMADIWREFPNTMYIIASEGPYETQLRKLAKSMIAQQQKDVESIQFVGKIDDLTKAALFMLCDVYVTPSRTLNADDAEGFGIVFLEANSYGKPVVAGNSGGIPDAVIHQQTGLLVSPENVYECSQAVQLLLRDSHYATILGTQGKERAEKEFSREVFNNKLHTILEESIG